MVRRLNRDPIVGLQIGLVGLMQIELCCVGIIHEEHGVIVWDILGVTLKWHDWVAKLSVCFWLLDQIALDQILINVGRNRVQVIKVARVILELLILLHPVIGLVLLLNHY